MTQFKAKKKKKKKTSLDSFATVPVTAQILEMTF